MSRGTEHMYTRVHLCTIVRGFCTVLCGGRGRGRDAALLQPPATVPAGDDSVQFQYEGARTGCWRCHRARRPGWMRLQVRPLAVGANLPKHWRDGQKALEGRTIDDQASEVLWVLSEICPTSAGVVSDQLRRYVVCILWVPRSGMEECIYMVPLHIYVIDI